MDLGTIMGIKTSISLRRGWLVSICFGGGLAALILATPATAVPRPPLWPPLPEFAAVLHHESFDEVYRAGVSNAVVVIPNYGTLRESWSGYALERVGTVSPLVIAGLDEAGRVQVVTDLGAVRFWFRPDWSSGRGPGAPVTLAELAAVAGAQSAVLWSLRVSPEGSVLGLVGPEGKEVLLESKIEWAAGSWHQVILNYGTNGTELVLDGQVVATGAGTLAVPASVTRLVVGSSLSGDLSARGELEEVFCFARPLRVAFHYEPFAGIAALGPMSEAEVAYRLELVEKWQALKAEQAKEAEESGGGMQMLRLVGGTSECVTNLPLYITNTACIFDPNQGWTVTFDIQGTNGPADIFSTTNLSDNPTNSYWVWLERGPSCNTYQYTNQPTNQTFYILGTPLDSDGDGMTDAYERLVSHTNPQVWNVADTDGDGMPDAWEVAHGLDPLVANGGEDPDLDALTNLQEYLGGTRPTVSEGFSIWVAQPQTTGNVP